MTEIISFDEHDAVAVGRAANILGRLIGGTVVMVTVQDADGRLAFMPRPGCAVAVFRYLSNVNWDDAIEGAAGL